MYHNLKVVFLKIHHVQLLVFVRIWLPEILFKKRKEGIGEKPL